MMPEGRGRHNTLLKIAAKGGGGLVAERFVLDSHKDA